MTKYKDAPNWIYNGFEFTSEMISDNYSFVYEITNTVNGMKYIGKKVFISIRTLPALKGKVRKRKVRTESDWKSYWGSSKVVQAQIDEYGIESFTREIISIHPDKREANYAELRLQIIKNVLEARDSDGNRIYMNENIDRVYYSSKNYGTDRCIAHAKLIKAEYNHL